MSFIWHRNSSIVGSYQGSLGEERGEGGGGPLLKDRKKVKGQNFPPVEPEEYIFWSKFGGIAPIPPAPVECQRSRDKIKIKWCHLADMS